MATVWMRCMFDGVCMVPVARGRLLLGILLVCLLLAPAVAAGEEAGRALYNFRCYVCHGYAGDAQTLAASFLTPPPRDFTATRPDQLTREAMIAAVTHGRPGTAMKPFTGVLSSREIAAVVDFVRSGFMARGRSRAAYHTPANGWPDHERYRLAFPFATGAIPLDTPWTELDPRQQTGQRLFFSACVSCHDRARVREGAVVWERQALSYPRFGFRPGDAQRPPDAVSGATPFARHDIPLRIAGLSAQERAGEKLFLANCAFCHGADGTGGNWIGQFLRPHARDLTDTAAMAGMTRARLRQVLREGLPGTSMPAWGAVLSDREIAAVIAYVARAFHPLASAPAGDVPPAGTPTGTR